MSNPRRLPYSSGQTQPGMDYLFEEPAAPQFEPQPGLSIAQIVSIVRFYWKLAALVVVGGTILSAIVLKFVPKTYTAVATLIVDADKKNPLAIQDLPDYALPSYIQTQMELLVSTVVLGPVVDRMKLTQDEVFAGGYGGSDEAGMREYAEKNLAKVLQVDLGRGGQLIYISATSKTSARAAEIANTVADVYLDEEKRRFSDPAAERAVRYTKDLEELRAKVAVAQSQLAAFRKRNSLTSVTAGTGADTDNETQALSNLELRLLDAQNLRRSLEAKGVGQQTTADETLASPVVQGLKTQLAQQESQLAQFSSTYGPQHPKVLELKSQIAATTQQINGEMRTLSGNVSTQLARARELETRFSSAVAEQRARVLKLRDQQGDGAKLTLELESAQSVYKRALDGYDQIMFASVGNSANVNMVSRATPPVKATKPNKLKLMLLCFMASLLLGLGGPVCYELFLDRRLRCRDDIERSFGIPVLAQFDPIVVTPTIV